MKLASIQFLSTDQMVSVCDILQERARQEAKWGEQNHSALEWQPILLEEFGELAQEVNRHYFGKKTLLDYRKELVQVAAVALAMLECLERNGT